MTFSTLLAAVVPSLLGWSFVNAVLGWALFFLSIFLILLILVQRGRGGGLAGALGGPGGQSAFGTKAGDLFTRITSFVALGWIALCAFTMWQIGSRAPAAIDPDTSISASPADQTPANSDLIDFGNLGGDSAAPANSAPATDDPATSAPAVEPATDGADGAGQAATEPQAADNSASSGTEDATEPAAATDSANP